MSRKDKSRGNILVNPDAYASRLEGLDSDRDMAEIERLENHLAHRLRLGGSITYIDEDGQHVIEDRNGIRPFAEGDEFPSPPDSAELEIRELAFQNGVHSDRSELDDWCEAVSANAGDDVQSDEVEQLIIGLRRLAAIDGVTLTKLHVRYMAEITSS